MSWSMRLCRMSCFAGCRCVCRLFGCGRFLCGRSDVLRSFLRQRRRSFRLFRRRSSLDRLRLFGGMSGGLGSLCGMRCRLLDLRGRNNNGGRACHALGRNHPRDVRRLFRSGRGSGSSRLFCGSRGLNHDGLRRSDRLRRFDRRLCGRTCRGRMRSMFLQRRDGLQYIARLGNLRQVDLGLRLIGNLGRLGRVSALPGVVLLDLLRLVFFDGTGMCLLFGDADLRQHFENLFAFDFQLSSQIVDSNLHPPFSVLRCPANPFKPSCQPRGRYCGTQGPASYCSVLSRTEQLLLFLWWNVVFVRMLAVSSNLGFIRRRRVFHALDDFRFIILSGLFQFANTFRSFLGNVR